ncbi:MAG: thermonuclease family protein [Alphaproteobacteria bacterium]
MRRSRLTRRVINQLPPGVRLIVILILLIGAGVAAWQESRAPATPPAAPVEAQLAKVGAKPAAKPSSHNGIVFQGTASVIDGDTLDLHGQRIRLHGIDAPESKQSCTRSGEAWRCGQAAALALAERIARQPIACEQRDIDRYKRIVAICRMGEEDLNAWLVRSGWAMAYRQFAKDYVADEDSARAARVGIWAGEVQPPWEWRRKSKG